MSEPMYYIQNSRSYSGNDVLWWAKEGAGYTTDLSKALICTESEAQKIHNNNPYYIPWPSDYIASKTRITVSIQKIQIDEALLHTNIVITDDR